MSVEQEIKDGLIEAAIATGGAELTCVVKKLSGGPDTPWEAGSETETLLAMSCIITTHKERDNAGLVVRTFRRLMVDALAGEPEKGDTVKIGSDPDWIRIMSVDVLEPGGVPLMYEVDLEQ